MSEQREKGTWKGDQQATKRTDQGLHAAAPRGVPTDDSAPQGCGQKAVVNQIEASEDSGGLWVANNAP